MPETPIKTLTINGRTYSLLDEEDVLAMMVDFGIAPVLLDADGAVITDSDGAVLVNN